MPNSVIQSSNGSPHNRSGSPPRGKHRASTSHSTERVRRRSTTHRYEQLRKSQQKLAWCMAAGVIAGSFLGYAAGNIAIGAGSGLALGLAFGVLASS